MYHFYYDYIEQQEAHEVAMVTRYIARNLLVKAALSIFAALAINTSDIMQYHKVDFKQINK